MDSNSNKKKFTTIQWLLPYHPAGKTSLKSSPLNIPGKLGWFLMEIVSPVTLLYVLFTLPSQSVDDNSRVDVGVTTGLPLPNRVLAGLFILHYMNRAIISPFFAAPSMSPIHVLVVSMAGWFNWVNASCLGGWLGGYSVSIRGCGHEYEYASSPGGPNGDGQKTTALFPGIIIFFLGMIGNIYSERHLFRLRREEGDRRAATTANDNNKRKEVAEQDHNKNKYNKVYVLPPAKGIFRSILYPHYVFEWLEWLGFALVGTAVFPSSRFVAQSFSSSAACSITLVPWLVPFAVLAEKLHIPFPLPAVLFFVNAVANMLPHARWGRKWYVEKFGERAVAGRGAVVPWCTWL